MLQTTCPTLIESTNTKLRVLHRMAFGFRRPEHLIALALLDRGGYCPPSSARTWPTSRVIASASGCGRRLWPRESAWTIRHRSWPSWPTSTPGRSPNTMPSWVMPARFFLIFFQFDEGTDATALGPGQPLLEHGEGEHSLGGGLARHPHTEIDRQRAAADRLEERGGHHRTGGGRQDSGSVRPPHRRSVSSKSRVWPAP